MIFIIRNFWGNTRPSSTESEDSEQAVNEPAIRRRIRRRSGDDPVANIEPANIEPKELQNHTLSFTFKLITCPSGVCYLSINENFIRQLESKIERYANEPMLKRAHEHVNELKAEAKLQENDEANYKKKFQVTKKSLKIWKNL